MKKQLFFLFAMLIAVTTLFAADFEKDGIAYNILTENTVEVTSKSPIYSGSVVIPEKVTYNSNTYSITTIGEYAFYHCIGLTSITVSNSVTTIGNSAFLNCSGLTSVTIPNSVTLIQSSAFSGCRGLTSIIIPNSVTTIGSSAFAGCSGLTSINIPNSVTTIGDGAFSGCEGLTSITIPNSVTSIGDMTFNCCRGLTSVTIGNSVTTIGNSAFSGCNSLTFIQIPNSVTTIGKYAFKDCTSLPVENNIRYADTYLIEAVDKTLSTYTIKDGTKWIGDDAFSGCEGLTSITIPNSVTTIGEEAFLDCKSLISIDVDDANTHYCSMDGVLFNFAKTMLIQYPAGNPRTEYSIPNSVTTISSGAFYGCNGLTSITIPNHIIGIGSFTFYGCSALTSITIPNSVYVIGSFAFSGCRSLTSITIPNLVTTIVGGAFDYCSSLKSITCYAIIPPACGYDVFNDISKDAKVYVPASALADYQNAKEWKRLQLYPIAADVTPMDNENPVVIPSDQDVTITWPITDGTDTYTLTITKNGEVVCVLTFNANGQLTNIAFAAPSHNGARQAPAATLTAQGYQFTVTGLDPGTAYDYSVTATDAGGQTLAEHKGNFSTTGGTGFESVHGSQPTMHKYFHNGNFIIERNGIKYTPAGQKVR